MKVMTNRIDCAEIDRALDRGFATARRSLSSQEQGHLAECERCTTLLRTLDEHSEPPTPQLALKRVEDALLLTLHPVRPLPPIWVFLLIFASVFLALVAVGVYRMGPYGWTILSLSQKIAVIACLGASASLLGFSSAAQMVPGSGQRISPALVPIVAFVLLALGLASVFQYERDPHFLRAGMKCFTAGIPYAIPAAVVFLVVLGRGLILRPMLSGATSGMLAGLIGTSVLEVHCPILDVGHILVWHLGVCVLGALLGLLAGYLGSRVRELRTRLRLLAS